MARARYTILQQMLAELPNWYDKDSNKNIYNIFNSYANELNLYSTEQDNLAIEIPIDTATGTRLDDLGKIFKLSRRPSETDAEFRVRVLAFWPGFSGGGTIDAIKSAISKVTGFDENDVEVNEQFTATDEAHFYINTQDNYRLNYQEALDTATLSIAGTAGGGAYTFIKNTDYILEDGYIKFNQGGTDPDNNTIYNVTYEYFDELRFQIVIPISPTSTLFDTIRELIPGIKAAGTKPYLVWLLSGGDLDDSTTVADSVTLDIISVNFFTIEDDLIEGEEVIS